MTRTEVEMSCSAKLHVRQSAGFRAGAGQKENRPDCLLVTYGNVWEDPPVRNTAEFMATHGYRVHAIQLLQEHVGTPSPGLLASLHEVGGPAALKDIKPLFNLMRWLRFRAEVRSRIMKLRPAVVIAIMLHPLAAVPMRPRDDELCLVSCIYDVPVIGDAGRLDKRIIQRGWDRLPQAHVVWASDSHKARLTQDMAALPALPLVCHNCPPRTYLPDQIWPRNQWLRRELVKLGARLNDRGGSILLRAGAIGEFGGIEETLHAMRELPDDYVFVMMGRPVAAYKNKILSSISELSLSRRAFLWDRPDEDVWKRTLHGADVGHLIHGPFPPGAMARRFELNSSLSNNRLFQYMAAGLPTISYDDPRLGELHREVSSFEVARLEKLKDDIQLAWRTLATDEARRKTLGHAARQAHLTKYCWEVQFTPLFEAITSRLISS